MPIAARSIIYFSLVAATFLTFQGALYVLNNRLQELGLLIVLLLFFYASLLAALNSKSPNLNWSGWLFGTFGVVGYFMFVPAYLYSQHTGAPMIPSALAAREVMVLFLCPAIYFLYRIGYPVKEIERAILLTVVLLVVMYMIFRFTLPLAQYEASSNRHVAALVVFDPIRGYRLVWPEMGITLAAIVGPIKIFTAKTTRERLLWVLVFLLTIWAMILYQGRSFTAGLILSVISFNVMFARKKRVLLLFFLAPLVISFYFGAILTLFNTIEEEYKNGEGIRFHSYSVAFRVIGDYPMLGFGMDSKTTIPEEEVFGSTFHSSDIGFIGITYRYGILGGAFYFFSVVWLNIRLIKANWWYFDIHKKNNPLLIALSVRCILDFLNIVLSTTYMYMEGLTIACLGIALSAIYKQEHEKHMLSKK